MGIIKFTGKETKGDKECSIELIREYNKNKVVENGTLTVDIGSTAIFVYSSKVVCSRGEGVYKLNSQSFPELASLGIFAYRIGSNLGVRVFIVSKDIFSGNKWITTNMSIESEDKLINVNAHGNVDFRITDPELFLQRLIENELSINNFSALELIKNTAAEMFETYEFNDPSNVNGEKDAILRYIKIMERRISKSYGVSLSGFTVDEIESNIEQKETFKSITAERSRSEAMRSLKADIEETKKRIEKEHEKNEDKQDIEEGKASEDKVSDNSDDKVLVTGISDTTGDMLQTIRVEDTVDELIPEVSNRSNTAELGKSISNTDNEAIRDEKIESTNIAISSSKDINGDVGSKRDIDINNDCNKINNDAEEEKLYDMDYSTIKKDKGNEQQIVGTSMIDLSKDKLYELSSEIGTQNKDKQYEEVINNLW